MEALIWLMIMICVIMTSPFWFCLGVILGSYFIVFMITLAGCIAEVIETFLNLFRRKGK